MNELFTFLFRSIKHDNVIQEVELIPDIPAITMELIEHGDLNSFLKQRKEPISNNI